MSACTRRIYADLASPFDDPDEDLLDELDVSDDEEELDSLAVFSFGFSVVFSEPPRFDPARLSVL